MVTCEVISAVLLPAVLRSAAGKTVHASEKSLTLCVAGVTVPPTANVLGPFRFLLHRPLVLCRVSLTLTRELASAVERRIHAR